MKKIFAIILGILCLQSIKSQQVCRDISKFYSDSYNRVFGQIHIPNVPLQEITNIEVHLSIAASVSDGDNWQISLVNTNVYNDLINNRGLTAKINFFITNPLPIVTAVFLNGNQICFDSPARGTYVSTIKLQYTYTISNVPQNIQPYSNPRPIYQNLPSTQRPYEYAETTRAPVTATIARIPQTSQNIANKIETSGEESIQPFVCGIKRGGAASVSFVLGGQKALRNDFPWLAAFYYRENGFICGGTLISARVVITAAHCIQDKTSIVRRSEYDSTIYLGKYNIKDLNERDYINSGVDQFIVHSDWNPQDERYKGDISIVILSKTIRFTNNIIPLCIWHQTTDHQDLNGKFGFIAGWGITDAGTLSDVPQFITLPVVDDAKCLRSNDVFYKISASSTFCVGDNSERTPCNGDSGGAFAVKNKDDGKYYLRGVVSSGVRNDEGQCARKEYVLFTDVAQYSDWIKSYMRTYG